MGIFFLFWKIFWVLGSVLLALSQPINFAWWAGCWLPGLSGKRRENNFGFDSGRGEPLQYLEHEEDDEDENEDEDEFEDFKG